MWREYSKKILFVSSALFFCFLAFFFLSFNHRDLLSHRVYSDASYYIHFNPQKIVKINNKYNSYLNQLIDTVGIEQNDKQAIYSLAGRELAVIKYPNTGLKFVALPNTKLESYLTANNISFFIDYKSKALYFPVEKKESFLETRSTLAEESTKAWFNLNFSLVKVYLSGKEFPFIDSTIVNQYNLPPIWVTASVWNDKLYVNTNVNVGKGEKSSIAINQNDLVHLFINEELPIKLKNSPKSLDYLLINSLHLPLEYVNSNDGYSVIRIVNSSNISTVLESVRQTLATVYPEEQNKTLPDGTPVTHLIANSEHIQVKEVSPQTYQFFVKEPVWVRLINEEVWVFVDQLSLSRANLVKSKTSFLGALSLDTQEASNAFNSEFTRSLFGKLVVCIY